MGAAEQLDLTHAVDDHIAHAQLGEITGADGDAVRQIRRGVPQVLHLAGQLLPVLIHQHQLIGDALHRQRIGHMGAHMAQSDHTQNPFLCHCKTLLCDKLPYTPKLGNSTQVYSMVSAM